MVTINDIVVLVAAVIAGAFLVYFATRLIIHRKENHTFCVAGVGIFIFIALFIRLLSISSPELLIYSDLFLLITVISVILLTIHMQKSFCSYCKDKKMPWDITKATLHKSSDIKRGR